MVPHFGPKYSPQLDQIFYVNDDVQNVFPIYPEIITSLFFTATRKVNLAYMS